MTDLGAAARPSLGTHGFRDRWPQAPMNSRADPGPTLLPGGERSGNRSPAGRQRAKKRPGLSCGETGP